jgi:phage portal protein BeeE
MNWPARILTNMMRPKRTDAGWWYRFYSSGNTWNDVDVLDAFNVVPELNATINLKARAHSNGIYKHVDADGNTVDDDLNKVLNSPNWFQAQKEFIRQCVLFHEIHGNEFIYALYPVGMPDKIKSLFTISPNLIEVAYNNSTPFFYFDAQPSGVTYKLKSEGNERLIEPDQIIHLNDNRVNLKSATDANLLLGESKIKPLRAVINNIKMAYESRGVILKHRGALGILSNAGKDGTGSPLPLDPGEIKRLQSEYTKYGGLDDQYNIIISDSNLKWQQMGTNPDRLGLFEEIEKDFDKILDAFGVPPEMFSSKAGATFENQRQAEKGLYVRTIIPEANERATALTARLLKGTTDRITVDFSHLPVFQEDLKSRADSLGSMINALSKALQDQAITVDQYKKELIRYGIEM